MNHAIGFLIAVLSIILISYGVASVITNIVYEGYEEFCEERNLTFEGNYGSPICYKINEGKANFISIGKLNGEIYIQ